MVYLFIILLCVLPFSGWIFKGVDIWNAHGIWFQIGLLVCFCCSFYFEPKKTRKNIPLGLLILWGGSLTLYISYQFMTQQGRYSVYYLFPFLNLLYLAIFYKLIVQYLDKKKIKLILKWLSYLILLTLFYCVIQSFKLDQLHNTIKGIYLGEGALYDLGHPAVIGFIGNPTHLSAYLGMCLPFLFLYKKPWLSISLLFIIISFFTNYGSRTVPITGIIVAIVTLLYCLFCFGKKKFVIGILILLILIGAVCLFFDLGSELLSAKGRIGVWEEYWEYIKPSFILGRGLGANKVISTYSPDFKSFNHLHNEFLQVLLELGIIGLLIIIYGVWDFFRIKNKSKEDIILKAVFLGFLVQSFTLFPAHLWMTSSLAMFVYGCSYIRR